MNSSNNVNNSSLLEQIRELRFVKTELELYLDTHPDCPTALDYYGQTLKALNSLVEQYTNTYGPLVAAEALNSNTASWSWVKSPWPWQNGSMAKNGEGRK